MPGHVSRQDLFVARASPIESVDAALFASAGGRHGPVPPAPPDRARDPARARHDRKFQILFYIFIYNFLINEIPYGVFRRGVLATTVTPCCCTRREATSCG